MATRRMRRLSDTTAHSVRDLADDVVGVLTEIRPDVPDAPGVRENRGTMPVIGVSSPVRDRCAQHHLASEVVRIAQHVRRGVHPTGGHRVFSEESQQRRRRRTAASTAR